jgi:hypothetical protein
MQAHTRALVAASAYAVITGKKIAGIFDHTANEQLRIAVECRGTALRGADGERGVAFGGTLPELYDDGDKAFISLEVDGASARGYDRGSQSHFVAEVSDRLIQVYDHGHSAWFAFEVLEIADEPFAQPISDRGRLR